MIKSYTDLEQSKKLAEILPLESADMTYIGSELIPYPYCDSKFKGEDNVYPSWSLAALLDIIPQELFDGEYIINITEGYDNKWILTYDRHENRNHSYYGLSIGADNLINACYELILKLNELKML